MNKIVVLTCLLWISLMFNAHANDGYRLPPQDVVDIIDAAPEPSLSFSPDRKWMLMIERNAMPGIEDISRRMLRLAGMRIDPAANSRFRTSFDRGILVRPMLGGETIRVPLPEGAILAGTNWAHDSNHFVYSLVTADGTELWVASVTDPANPKRLTDRLSTVMGGAQWMPDAKHLVCQLVPVNRGSEPVKDDVPSGPNVQESLGNTSPTRTYQDLLSNAYDEKLFDYYATAELHIIGIDGSDTQIGPPAIYATASPSPDGEHLLVTQIKRPYSYLQTVGSFPRSIDVWHWDGARVEPVFNVAQVPLAENIPIEGVRTGPRNVDWMSSRPATLAWAEALDGGDPNVQADHRDRIMFSAAPFDQPASELIKIQHRWFGLSYLSNPMQVVTTEYDRDKRWIRALLHDLAIPDSTPKALIDRSVRDRYGDKGTVVQVADENGHLVVLQQGDLIFRRGSGASPKGNLPFLDAQDLNTMETTRLWRCEEGVYESAVALVTADPGQDSDEPTIRFITSRESKTVPTNYFLRTPGGDMKPLTDFKDPTPQIRGIKKELVTYQRSDGVPLSATLYLPANYQPGEKLPLIVWAYPREYNDVKTAGQISGSPHRFTRMRGITHLTLLTQGYAIMDSATMPVIGDPETMNDTFIEQIVDAAQAAIDYAVERGVADRKRVAVGGHSYGAFMTANLLAHSDLFQAGIARSGAYNRTLTPFGFQSERRSFWDAKNIYFSISPFMHANKISEPLLLIHGEEDNNSGTFPIQSKRMYQAVKGNGGTVRLVMLPKESHGYRARESVLHTQAEMIDWLDKYVKNAN